MNWKKLLGENMVDINEINLKKIFSNPYSLIKTIKLWKECEREGEEFIREIIEKRKKELVIKKE